MSLYRQIEKTFFFTLTRKIVGNVGFLMLLQAVLFWLAYDSHQAIQALVSAQAGESELARQVGELSQHHLWLIGGVAAVSLGAGVFLIFFMRHLFLEPVRAITRVLRAIKEKDGDISATLPAYTYDEISDMAASYNAFAENLRSVIAKTRRRSVKVAMGSTHLKQAIQQAYDRVSEQEACAFQVFQSSSEATRAIDDIAQHTTAISTQNGQNLAEVRASSQELAKVVEQVEAVNSLVNDFNETVNQLSRNSENISKILGMVQEFSEQTNLLALNAAIEAARAGEHGRGFAVVADEVRGLSQKVNEATGEIARNISEMTGLVESTRKGTEEIQNYADNTRSVMINTATQFEKMVGDFEAVNSQLTEISAAIEELSLTNRDSHEQVSRITALSREVKEDIDRSQSFSDDLELSTEQTQELLSRFIIGYGGFENMIQTARQWRIEVQEAMEGLAAQGLDLFDTQYQPVPNTNPQKYTASYVPAFEQVMQPLYDRFIKERPEFIYAVAVAKDGYLPAHHSHVSKPVTGNFEEDNKFSRHQRIYFSSRAEIRRAENTEPFLLQTFIRDTGEVLNDLSLPVMVNGKHWGAFLLGFTPEHLLEKS